MRNEIEEIGLDRIVLSVQILKLNMEKIKAHKKGISITYDESSEFYGMQYIKIIDNCRFSTLRAGVIKQNEGYKQYCYLDLSLAFINKEKNNLYNCSIENYLKSIEKIIIYIKEEYGIEIDKKGVKFQQMEINCNIILSKPFAEYKKLLRIWMYILSNRLFQPYMKEYKYVNKKERALEPQTFQRGNEHMEFNIYDKKAQLMSKGKNHSCQNLDIMRVEIKLKTSQKIREVFHTNNIYYIKTEQVKNFFLSQIEKNIVKQYKVWKDTNRLELSIMLHRNKANKKNWILDTLRECIKMEYEKEIPLIVDINDYIEAVNKEDKYHHNKRNEEKIRDYCRLFGYIPFDESSKFNEIVEKIRSM